MRNFFWGKAFFVAFILGLFLFGFTKTGYAAFLNFDKSSVNANLGEDFQIEVLIDTEGEEVVSSDAYVLYDSDKLEAVSVQAQSFFDTVAYDISQDWVYIGGTMDNIGVGKSGSGSIATITFRAKDSGNIDISFLCDLNATRTSKIIKIVGVEAQNIINCSSNGTTGVVIASSGNLDNQDSNSNNTQSDSTVDDNTDSTSVDNSDLNDLATNTTNSANSDVQELPKAGIVEDTITVFLIASLLLGVGFLLGVFAL